MRMTEERLQALADIAQRESPFTRASLAGLGDEAAIRKLLEVEFDKHLKAHESKQGLIDRIRKVTGMEINRARTIMQTERTRALNGERMSAAINDYLAKYEKAKQQHEKRPEIPKFQWINPLAAKEPRHSHVAISGDVQEAGAYFLPSLRYPGDPEAPAEETINCHCYIRRWS